MMYNIWPNSAWSVLIMPRKGQVMTEEYREACRERMQARWEQPEYRANMLARWQRPGYLENMQLKLKEHPVAPHVRAAVSKAHKGMKHTDEAKAKMSEASRNRWQTQEYRDKHAASMHQPHVREALSSPERGERIRQSKLQYWAQIEPADRSQRSRKWIAAGARAAILSRGPTDIERLVAAVLDAIGIEYLTQHELGWYHVDFYIPAKRLVIECDGAYWHNSKDALSRDQRRDAWLTRHGYRVVRLAGVDIKADAATCVAHALGA